MGTSHALRGVEATMPACPDAEPRWLEVQQLPLEALASACREELSQWRRHEPTGDIYGYELFRRAICERDQEAWTALYAQYRGLVLAWLSRHPAWASSHEDEDYCLNRTFERFWAAVGPAQFASFPGLASLLSYLRLCAHSALLDAVRSRGAWEVGPLSHGGAPEAVPDIAAAVDHHVTAHELWQAISAELADDTERLVAHHCLVLGLKPREVYARYPDRYASVEDVYRVKRNLLDRLRRNPTIRQFLA